MLENIQNYFLNVNYVYRLWLLYWLWLLNNLLVVVQFSLIVPTCSRMHIYQRNFKNYDYLKYFRSNARYSTLAVGIVYFLFACSAPFLIERVGRRFLLIFQLGFCTISLFFIAFLTYIQQNLHVSVVLLHWKLKLFEFFFSLIGLERQQLELLFYICVVTALVSFDFLKTF